MTPFAAAVFTAIKTGIPDLVWVEPKDVRQQDIMDETMLAQRRFQSLNKHRVAQHWSGHSIRCAATREQKKDLAARKKVQRKIELGRRRKLFYGEAVLEFHGVFA